MPPVRLVQVVSVWAASSLMPPVRLVPVTIQLMPLVWAVRLSCQALVALVMLMVMLMSVVFRVSASLVTLLVVFWRLVPVMVLRWSGCRGRWAWAGDVGVSPRHSWRRVPLLLLLGGGCDGAFDVVGAAWGGRW